MTPILLQANFATIDRLQIEVDRIGNKIQLNHLLISGLSGEDMRQLRNALISSVGLPEGQDLDEIDIDNAGLAEACDKIAAHITAGGGVR